MKAYYIGLDVHKESVFMAILDDRKVPSAQKSERDVIGTGKFPAGSSKLVEVIQQCQEKGSVLPA